MTEFDDVVLVGDAAGFFCSGVIVKPRVVLTAAHCAHGTRIAVGHLSSQATTIPIIRASTHAVEDIAVLALDRDVEVRVHALRLSDHGAPVSEIAIAGFGVRDPERVTGFGIKRIRRVLPDGWGCDLRRGRELGCRPETELLLQGGHDDDTCFGDSGGGAFERTSGGWRLIGITSRGTSPKRVVCGEGGVYVRIDVVHAWLAEQGAT